MTLELDKNEVRDYLITLAREHRTCGYKELAEDIAGEGAYTIGNNDGNYVAYTAGAISEDEARAGRPLLSVLIVNQDTRLPGGGFFKLAQGLGLFHGDVDSEADRREYTKYEFARVYDYWSTQIDDSDKQEILLFNKDFDTSKTPEEKEYVVKLFERGQVGNKVKALNGYKCQVCEAMGLNPFSFLKRNDTPYVESHHVIPMSSRRSGVLSASNIITVCANHHRQMHYGKVELIDETDELFTFVIDAEQFEISRVKVSEAQ